MEEAMTAVIAAKGQAEPLRSLLSRPIVDWEFTLLTDPVWVPYERRLVRSRSSSDPSSSRRGWEKSIACRLRIAAIRDGPVESRPPPPPKKEEMADKREAGLLIMGC